MRDPLDQFELNCKKLGLEADLSSIRSSDAYSQLTKSLEEQQALVSVKRQQDLISRSLKEGSIDDLEIYTGADTSALAPWLKKLIERQNEDIKRLQSLKMFEKIHEKVRKKDFMNLTDTEKDVLSELTGRSADSWADLLARIELDFEKISKTTKEKVRNNEALEEFELRLFSEAFCVELSDVKEYYEGAGSTALFQFCTRKYLKRC